MKTFSRHMGITLPITTEFHCAADSFAKHCPVPAKAEQIRRNTLAVCAVNAYLELMEIPTRLSESDSWSPMMQMMSDVADLKVPGLGTLSCRAISPGDETCYVPPEAWVDRAGYVAIVLDESSRQATLLGFTKTVTEQEQVPLSQFMPIETLIDLVHELQSVEASSEIAQSLAAAHARVVQLGQWFRTEAEGLAESGWLAVEKLMDPDQMGLAFRTIRINDRTDERPTVNVSRVKQVSLGIQSGQPLQVALVIQLMRDAPDTAFQGNPTRANQQNSLTTNILLQVRPLGASLVLPEGVILNVLGEQGNVFMSATSRSMDNCIQLQLSGQTGEQFSVQILMAEASFEEPFAI